jgi:hypothetical protein
MGTISQYTEASAIMEINISYGDEKFSFNLNKELVINENKINHEAQVQPSSYAFISMLHKKLIRVMKDREYEMDKRYSELFSKFKVEKDPSTGKPIANDTVKAKILQSLSYQRKVSEFLDAEEKANMLEVCVKSFDQRSFLIQTISANIRKER